MGWLGDWFGDGFLDLLRAGILGLAAFVGDILNTAARLEEYAKRTGHDLVVSGAVLDKVAPPPGVRATSCGELALRGKEACVTAYGLSPA